MFTQHYVNWICSGFYGNAGVCWQMLLFCHQQAVGFISLADIEAGQCSSAAQQRSTSGLRSSAWLASSSVCMFANCCVCFYWSTPLTGLRKTSQAWLTWRKLVQIGIRRVPQRTLGPSQCSSTLPQFVFATFMIPSLHLWESRSALRVQELHW